MAARAENANAASSSSVIGKNRNPPVPTAGESLHVLGATMLLQHFRLMNVAYSRPFSRGNVQLRNPSLLLAEARTGPRLCRQVQSRLHTGTFTPFLLSCSWFV